MVKKSFLLIISTLFGFSLFVNAQEPQQAPQRPQQVQQVQPAVRTAPPIDSIHNRPAIELCKQILAKDFSNPLFNRVSVFGNPDCGHCKEVEAMMTEKNMDFDVYDLRDNNLLMRVHDLIVEKEKTGQLAYGFPIVIYKGEISYNFKDAKAFVEELSKKVGK